MSDASERTRRLELVCSLGRLVSSSLDLETVIDRAMRAAEEVANAEASSIWRLDPEGKTLSFWFASSGVTEALRSIRIPVGQGIVGHAVAERKPFLVADAAADPRWKPMVDAQSGFVTKSILTLPLVVEDRVLGAIQLLNKAGGGLFDEGDLELAGAMAGQIAIAIENAEYHKKQVKLERLRRDLELASSIHEGIFPETIPQPAGYAIAGRSETCYEVGGDYYDAIVLEDRTLLLTVADVAGKGIAAALIAASLRASLHTVRGLDPSLVTIARNMNRMRFDANQRSRTRFITCVLMRLDPGRNTMEILNAGHNPPLVIDSTGEMRELPACSVPFGIVPEPKLETTLVALEPGSLFFAYSDGITEAFHQEEEYGLDRLKELLRTRRTEPPDRLLADLWTEVTDFIGDESRSDDMTALLIARQASGKD